MNLLRILYSYWYDERVIMTDSMQWNPVYGSRELHLLLGLNLASLAGQCLSHCIAGAQIMLVHVLRKLNCLWKQWMPL